MNFPGKKIQLKKQSKNLNNKKKANLNNNKTTDQKTKETKQNPHHTHGELV